MKNGKNRFACLRAKKRARESGGDKQPAMPKTNHATAMTISSVPRHPEVMNEWLVNHMRWRQENVV